MIAMQTVIVGSNDCDDNNSKRNPSINETLDGIDNNCNELVDETFYSTDADGDDLLGL